MFSPRHLGVLLIMLPAALQSLSADGTTRLPEGSAFELPSGLELPEDLHASALGGDGAFAFATPRERGRRIGSTVTIQGANGEQQRLELNLRLRDLLWLSDGRLLAVGFRAERRTRGEAFLLSWDTGKNRFKRVMRLPPTAHELTHTSRGDGLLLTARNELRVITLPLLRSGPLYRVLGENRAAAVVGDSRVLIGQTDALLLVDLDDRQSREEMPVRERLTVDSPVEQLSIAEGGRSARAGLRDGSVRHVQFEPLRIEDAGSAHVTPSLAAPESPSPPPTEPRPPSPASVSRPEIESTEPKASPAPPPASVAAATPNPDSAIHGQLIGPALAAVKAVVAFGPDSLLREAARTSPTATGSYDLGPLPPGRYRIQLDAGGGKLLVSEPAFHIVDVSHDSNFSLGFRVLQAQ